LSVASNFFGFFTRQLAIKANNQGRPVCALYDA